MYKVNEIFYSLQGEGVHTGTPAVFVRLSVCNRRCAFCDTDFAAYREMTADEIVAEMLATLGGATPRHAVITGGEPALQLDAELVDAIKAAGFYTQIETNGTLPVPDNIDWVTCSPKEGPWRIQRVDELKIVYLGSDPELVASHFQPKVKCLQPCSGQNIAETIAYILAHPTWRLSLQTHKLVGLR